MPPCRRLSNAWKALLCAHETDAEAVTADACRKPTAAQMTKRLLMICQAEGLQVNEATLVCLVEGTNGDIRAILGQLQMIRLRRSVLAYDDAKVQSLLSNAKKVTRASAYSLKLPCWMLGSQTHYFVSGCSECLKDGVLLRRGRWA